MADDAKTTDRKVQPRFSQFALATARDTSAFEPTAPAASIVVPTTTPERDRSVEARELQGTEAGVAATARVAKVPRSAKLPSPPPAADDAELISFTVRLPAALYMRMRRSLGLREKLGELCVAAITRELDGRR